MDLSIRGWLEIESTGGENGSRMLASAEPPKDGQDPVESERVLLEWLPGPATPQVSPHWPLTCQQAWRRCERKLVRDAVHNGWLRRLHHHERTRAGNELASQLRAFRHELRSARAGRGPEILDGPLLPYALGHSELMAQHEDLGVLPRRFPRASPSSDTARVTIKKTSLNPTG